MDYKEYVMDFDKFVVVNEEKNNEENNEFKDYLNEMGKMKEDEGEEKEGEGEEYTEEENAC
jgi:hypothetical protein